MFLPPFFIFWIEIQARGSEGRSGGIKKRTKKPFFHREISIGKNGLTEIL
jgi:hypothetical protein